MFPSVIIAEAVESIIEYGDGFSSHVLLVTRWLKIFYMEKGFVKHLITRDSHQEFLISAASWKICFCLISDLNLTHGTV